MADDNTKPFLDKMKDFWTEVSTRESQVVQNNNGDQMEEKNKERSRLYRKLIVMLALSIVFWSGAKTAVSRLKGWALCAVNVYINFALASMMMGAAAGSLPGVFRWHLGLSGNGVLQGLLFNILAYNYEVFTTLMADSLDKLYQAVLYWVIGGISAVSVTLIWTLATEDPLCALVVLRIIWRFFQWIWGVIRSCTSRFRQPTEMSETAKHKDATNRDLAASLMAMDHSKVPESRAHV